MAQLAALPAASWLALVPVAWRPGAAPEVLGVAANAVMLAVDVRLTPGLAPWLARQARLAAWHAQPLHSALSLGRPPAASPAVGPAAGGGPRWACATLAAQLLAEGGSPELTPAGLAAAQKVAPPPDPVRGLEELAASLRALQATLAGQGAALRAAGLSQVSRLESAAVAAISEMEAVGMPLCAARWRAATRALSAQNDAARLAWQRALGGPPAADEAAMVARLRRLGHRIDDLRPASLARLPAPLAEAWRRARQLAALARRFSPDFALRADRDGRLRAHFDQIGAATGRMACRQPNLQGMPHGLGLREALRAPPGRVLVSADWRAAELRILAQIVQEPHFLRSFAEARDLHRDIASRLFELSGPEAVTPQMRTAAKTIAFGLVYGMGEGGLAQALGWPRGRAAALMQRFVAAYPRLHQGLAELEQAGVQAGVARSLAGRRLRLAGLPAGSLRRVARNMPVQGTNADMCKLALADLRRRLRPLATADIVMAVHDELVVECQQEDAAAAGGHLEAAMRAASDSLLPQVPTAVDVAVGPSWGADAD